MLGNIVPAGILVALFTIIIFVTFKGIL